MQFKKLLEGINDGWELEDNYDVDLNVLDDMNSFIYEIRNTIRGAYTKATTYKELAAYIRNDLIQPLEDLARDIEYIKEDSIDESLKEYWEDNGYRQHVWILLKDESDAEGLIDLLGDPDGEGDYNEDDEHSYVLDYYFDSYEEAEDFSNRIPDDVDWNIEETDEESEHDDYYEDDFEESLNETAEADSRVKLLKQKITKLDDYGNVKGYDTEITFDSIKDTIENHLAKYRDELADVYDSPEFMAESKKLDLDEALGLKE